VGRVSELIRKQADSGHVDATSSFITSRGLAVVAIISERAGDRGVNAAHSGVADRGGTDGIHARDGSVHTSISSVSGVQTGIVSASIIIIAGAKGIDALAVGRVAAIDSAQNAVIAVYRHYIAFTVGRVTH
jgi:hypothetical protein